MTRWRRNEEEEGSFIYKWWKTRGRRVEEEEEEGGSLIYEWRRRLLIYDQTWRETFTRAQGHNFIDALQTVRHTTKDDLAAPQMHTLCHCHTTVNVILNAGRRKTLWLGFWLTLATMTFSQLPSPSPDLLHQKPSWMVVFVCLLFWLTCRYVSSMVGI